MKLSKAQNEVLSYLYNGGNLYSTGGEHQLGVAYLTGRCGKLEIRKPVKITTILVLMQLNLIMPINGPNTRSYRLTVLGSRAVQEA